VGEPRRLVHEERGRRIRWRDLADEVHELIVRELLRRVPVAFVEVQHDVLVAADGQPERPEAHQAFQ
jgi:hypothetical protein